MAKAKRKKNNGWGLFLLFWTMLLLMLGFLACVVLYKYAAVYEETRPEKTMDALMAQMSEDDWRETLASTAGGVSRYEDARVLFDDYFDSTVSGKEISYRRDLSRSDAEQTVFVLYAGRTRLGEVRLVPVKEEVRFGFGRTQWQLDSISSVLLTDKLQGLTVLIDAPDGVMPVVNGVALGEEQILDPAVELTEVGALEQRFTTSRARMVRYEVGPLYGEIKVTDPEGEEIAPAGEPEEGVLRYVILPAKTYSFRIEAPEGVTVSVNGAVLGEEEIAGRDATMFRKLDSYLPEGGYDTLIYAADGLYTEPEIRAEYEGVEITPVADKDGKLIAFFPSDAAATQEMRTAVQGFFDAYMQYSSYAYNGVALKNLRDRTLPGTELDSYFSESGEGMIWARATVMSSQELKFDNFHLVGDNCFTCTIRYKADHSTADRLGRYFFEREDGYKMVFIRQNGQWLAATMSAFE